MIIRHDIADQEYLDLGEEYSASMAYIDGCAGTLIQPDWILTAAHCVVGRQQSLFYATHKESQHRIDKIVPHPDFDLGENPQHDIALIQLKNKIHNGAPAKLYVSKDETGKQVIFVGRGKFGNGIDGPTKRDGRQRGSTNTIIGASEQWLEFVFDKPENATALEGISGGGDSGGPAFITTDSQLYVAGVSSFQRGDGHQEGTYGVREYYARVSSNVEWIETVISNAETTSVIPDHPIIDAIKSDNKQQLINALNNAVLNDEVIMQEALLQTVVLNRVSLARELITRGADIGSILINELSVYELAMHSERLDYLRMLIFRFPHLKNIHGERSRVLPLLIDIAGRDTDPQVLEAVDILLNQGANINAQTRDGDTAVILAGWISGNLDLVTLLVERGADVNIPNNNGDTPLIDAAYKGRNEILEYLLENGADASIKNYAGRSALDMARHNENQYAVDLLIVREQ